MKGLRAVTFVGFCFLASQVSAQSRQLVSVQASALLMSLNGESFDDLGFGTGLGGEFQLRLNFPSSFSIGIGMQISKHSADEGFQDDLTLTGFFAEPRYAFQIASRSMRPYVAGRLAYLHQGITLESGTAVTATGSALGAGGGAVVRLSSRVNLDLGLALTTAKFGDYEAGGANAGAAGDGSSFVFKVGLNLGLGQ